MLWLQSIFVGIVVGIIGFIISLAVMYYTDPTFNLQKYTFWKEVIISYVLTGIITFLIFEYFEFNALYCSTFKTK